ncbi:MAG: DEAD/DEAH box helicase [Myxococcota bacterium]
MTNPADLFPDLPAPIARALAARGFTALTPVQRAVVEAELAGRDLRVSSQTGSGKTVAIGLALAAHFLDAPPTTSGTSTDASPGPDPSSASPDSVGAPRSRPLAPAAMRARSGADPAAHPRALVVVPTRELAAQVRAELAWLFAELPGATVEVVTGGTSVLRERLALARKPAFVVGTPGRLLDHMRGEALACDAIEHVILDEADQMLDMGFKDELDAILEQLPEQRASHLVSATFPQAVKALADRFQRDALTVQGTKPGDAHPDIDHVAHAVRRAGTYGALVNVLLLAGDTRCLLFVNRRVDAVELAEKLAADGFGAAPFSGELPQSQRTRTLAAFRTGILPILVSTDVAARGIDVPEIGTVVHVDPPRNAAAYVHRSGRTGRAGRTGRSIVLVDVAESRRVARMLDAARVAVDWRPAPTRGQVEAALDKRARKTLGERLDAFEPSEPQRIAAKQLLTERDPVELVAALVELAKPRPPRLPMDVEVVEARFDAGRGRRGRTERPARAGRPEHAAGSREGGAGRERQRSAAGFQPFYVSWGERAGATPARLLSHVCRRGGISGEQIGAIRVFAKNALVEIASDVADAFAARAQRPDERDPGITIERAVARRGADDRRVRTERPVGGPARTMRAAQSGRPVPPEGPARADRSIRASGPARSARRDRPDDRPERPARAKRAGKAGDWTTGPTEAAAERGRARGGRPPRPSVGQIAARVLERHAAARTAGPAVGGPKARVKRKPIPAARRVDATQEAPGPRSPDHGPHARGRAADAARRPSPKHARKDGPKGRPAGGPRAGSPAPASRKRR